METRGRGREARASTDDTRSNPSTTTRSNPTTPAPQHPLTRSRLRRSTPSVPNTRAPRTRRSTRAATFASSASVRRSPASDSTLTNASPVPPSTSDRPRRGQPPRRPTSAQPSTPAATPEPNPTLRPTRKRTRPSSRRTHSPPQHTPSSSAAASSSSGAAASSAAGPATSSHVGQSSHRPSKRQRRSFPSRSLRSAALAGSSRANSAGPSGRQTRAMSSAGAGDSGQRSHDQNAQRRDGEGPSSLDSERAGPTTLQGLLRRLGADLSDIFPGNSGSSHSRLQQLRNAIANPDNTEQQLEALSDLCEFLSVGTEESMVSFSVNLFVGPLVNLLRTGANIEVKIYSARALTHMMEALPSSSSAIAINGAAGPLCENLLTIEYIDLAEQSLSALHKLSVDYPQQIVSANGFQAVLSFIEFFSIGMQRLAASTACNLCRSPRSDAMEMISGVLPTMMQLLDSDDRRIRESAVVGFTRLAEAFRSSYEKLETLCGSECALIEKVLGLIVPRSPPAISPQTYSSALRLLALLSRGSPKLGLKILATEPLIEKLNTKLSPDSTGHEIDCLHLADSLLPEICDSETQGQPPRTRRPRRTSSSSSANIAVDAKRREELERDKGSLQFFGQTLFMSLMKFYVSSADANARRVALSVLSKFIAISSSDVLTDVIEERNSARSSEQRATNVRFCPFVAGLLGENSTPNESLIGLAMAASTLQKLPSLKDSFFREGVVHEILRHAKVSPSDGETAVQSGTVEGASTGNVDNGPNPTPENALSNIDFQNPESIWVVVNSLQRGTLHRIGRGEVLSTQSRPPSRAIPEFRMLSSVAIPILVSKAAQSILKLNLGANSDGSLNEDVFKNNALGKLTEVCRVLSSSQDSREQSNAQRALQNLVKLLTAPERLTIFEISRSGTLGALYKYLSPTDASALSNRIQVLLKCLNADRGQGAFSSLVQLSLGGLASEEKLPLQVSDYHHGTPSSPVSAGLRHLSQPFKLRLRKATPENGGTGLRDYAHHVVLIEPLATMASVQEFLWPRVREAERPPSAATPPVTRRRSSRGDRSERDSAVLQDNDSAPVDHADPNENPDEFNEDRFDVEEMLDMEEENQDEDAVVDDEEEHNSDGSDDEASSGDEDMIEHDAGESDDNENEGPDSMDVDQLARFIPPFELDHDALGQAPARSSSLGPSPGRGGSASRASSDPSRQDSAFRSYAAALAANIQRSSGHPLSGRPDNNAAITHGRADRRPGRRNTSSPKLVFSLNGKTVSHDCSILSAVIQANSHQPGISPRIWSDVHVLVYGKAGSDSSDGTAGEGSMDATVSTTGNAAASDSAASRPRRSQRLQEHRDRSTSIPRTPERRKKNEDGPTNDLLSSVSVTKAYVPVPRDLPFSDLPGDLADTIGVLRHLNWIFRRMSSQNLLEAVPFDMVGLRETTNVEFLSHKISAKMIRQLSDPVALCGGVIPEWCFALARDASFLMPFETRRILFQSTSLGVPRALHSLQTRMDMSGAGNAHRSSRPHREEPQIGRLQRQKVRVHRHRILESAIKVMNYYSTHSTVLEVQYFDEAGTGLGPTLEFYTMASRELQRVDLRLWRANTNSISKQKEIGGSISAAHRINKALNSISPSGKGRRLRRPSNSSSGSSASNGNSNDQKKESSEGVPAFVIPTGRGLFPSCLPIYPNETQLETNETTTALFGFVGRLLGKAMVDGRLVDLRLSETFSRLLLSYCRVIHDNRKDKNSHVMEDEGIEDIDMSGLGRYCIDDELEQVKRTDVWKVFTSGRSAMKMMEDVDVQLASSLKTIIKMIEGGEGESIPALCLTFVLPGDDNIELIRGGANADVTGNNAEEFVRRVVYHVLFGGVYQQVEALLRGFGDLIDVTRLLMFESDELELLSCGPAFEKWTVEFLIEATRCDHGYSHESTSVLYFLRILSELDHADQQKFVLFTTGSPALPLGGLRNLHPKLTIVRRAPETGRSPDECLPTVMTCTNYFKLPDYSSYEVAKKQVMYAVREGQRSFHLS